MEFTQSNKFDELSADELKRLSELCRALKTRILAMIDVAVIIETNDDPHIAVIAFENMNGEMLATRLSRRGISVMTASPCSDPQNQLLSQLKSLDTPFSQAMGAIRLFLNADITEKDIDVLVNAISEEVAILKKIGGIV